MLNSYFRLPLAAALLFVFTGVGGTQPPARDRIRGPVDAAQTAAVKGTAHPMARPESDQGRADTRQRLSGLSIVFRPSPAQQTDMNQLLRDQQDTASPHYHKWLTPEQYAARFGMTPNDLAKVTSWAQSQGLTVDSISRNRNEISFSGTVGQIEYALKTEIHNYSINGELHFANATDVALPAAFANEVQMVRGLHDFRPKPRFRRVAPRFTSSLSGIHNLGPGDFTIIYDLPSAYNGSGQTIAVVGQTNISNTDIDAFRSAAGLAKNDPTVILVPNSGALTHSSGDETEADLDLEWAGAIASSASIKYITVGNDTNFSVFNSLDNAIQNNVAPVISISYGNCESGLSNSFILTLQQEAQQANAQGQTISGPAGDDGAADCDNGVQLATQGLAVDVPASLPEVTGVGGSEFTGDSSTCPSTGCTAVCAPADLPYWSGSCGSSLTVGNPSGVTALVYIPEITWNDGVTSQGFFVGGGGASTIFGKPSWQAGTGVPSDNARDVPDIALSASPNHDGYLICSQDFFVTGGSSATSCTSGFRASDQSLARIGGTSAGAPSFAGILALINQATSSNGLGNVNPMLYSLAASAPTAFHDITTGTNKVPCTTGTASCPSGTTSIGFTAGVGYDKVTGLGSLDVANLIAAWVAATPSPDFSLNGLNSTISSPGVAGTSTVTVSAISGFTGTVNLTCAPTSATVHITCSLAPASVTLSGSATTQTSVLTITTVAARLDSPPGSHPRGIWFASGSTLFAALVLCGVPLRRRRRSIFFGLFGMMLASIITIAGCGGGSSSGGGGGGGSTGTPAGTYAITVTGTDASTSTAHSANVSVKVL